MNCVIKLNHVVCFWCDDTINKHWYLVDMCHFNLINYGAYYIK